MRRRRRKWLLVPAGLLLLMAVLTLAAFLRGTRADADRRMPDALDDEPVCYIYRDESGAKEARCAVRLAASMDEVWDVIADYEHFGDICEFIQARQIIYEPDGRCRLEARVKTITPGQLPFAVEMRHEQKLACYTASWDQPSGAIEVNRGAWTLTPLGPRETLLEVSLEIQMQRVPTFLLRIQSLERLRDAALAVRRRLREGSSGKTW